MYRTASIVPYAVVGMLASGLAGSRPETWQALPSGMSVGVLQERAEQGDVEAQVNLAARYANGIGMDRNLELAAAWYRKAAERGHPRAQVNLGSAYFKGEGVPKDYTQAALWYRRAADQGDAMGQFNLGVCYSAGLGVARDDGAARALYEKSAAQGNGPAVLALGAMKQTPQATSKSASPSRIENASGRPLTNQDVVALVKAGLSADVVSNAVEMATSTGFDLSATDLLELAQSGVPNIVISTMQARSSRPPRVLTEAPAPQAIAAPTLRPCLIVKIYEKRAADAFIRWTQPKPYNYVEGQLPVGVKFRNELNDGNVREIQSMGGHVVVLRANYALADLEDARKSCATWQAGGK